MAGKAALTSSLPLGRSEVLRSLRAQSQYKDITPSIAWRREAWKEEALDDLPLKGRERAIVDQTNTETVSKETVGKFLRDGVERIWAFPSA